MIERRLLLALMTMPATVIACAVTAEAAAVKCITQKGYVAAISKEDLEEALDYLVQKDFDALQTMMKQGRAIVLKPGIVVYRTGSEGFLGATVKFRLPGYKHEFWTVMEALKVAR